MFVSRLRPASATALALLVLASPALSDTIRGEGAVVRATLYPEGATITRRVVINAPAGQHQIVISGLPVGTDPNAVRVAATGATVGAVSLQTGRALPADVTEPQPVIDARARVEAAEKALRDHDLAAQAIIARADAAKETIAFIRELARSEGALNTDLATLAASVQTQFLAARREVLAAEAEAADMAPAREPLVRALEKACADLAAIDPPEGERAALLVQIEVPSAGEVVLEISAEDSRAGWAPVYDFRLAREAGTLSVDRGVVVQQNTGQDWQGVNLTMSTARPSGQTAPSELDSEIISTVDEDDGGIVMEGAAPAPMASGDVTFDAIPRAQKVEAQSRMQGLTLVFDYPRPADLRSGVDGLRLDLGSVALTPTIRAEAVPLYDTRATLVAESINGEQILLPGSAYFYADGTLVGVSGIDLTAAGDKLTLGFGPIDGLTVERRTADRSQGDRGLITRSDTDAETIEIEVENLTDRDWPLRIIDRVPVSEEEDLRVAWTAEPQPTEQNPDGKRGVLYWDQTLTAGATQTIRLNTEISWPAGRRLLR